MVLWGEAIEVPVEVQEVHNVSAYGNSEVLPVSERSKARHPAYVAIPDPIILIVEADFGLCFRCHSVYTFTGGDSTNLHQSPPCSPPSGNLVAPDLHQP